MRSTEEDSSCQEDKYLRAADKTACLFGQFVEKCIYCAAHFEGDSATWPNLYLQAQATFCKHVKNDSQHKFHICLSCLSNILGMHEILKGSVRI